MKPDLQRECDRIVALLARADEDEIRTRYQVGEIICRIKTSEVRYGVRAVSQLALALERDEGTLYRYALVAEAWTSSQLTSLLARRMPSGVPLTWSHLVELAVVRPATARAAMVELAFERGLSVRELGARIRNDVPPELDSAPRAVARFRRIVAQFESTRDRLRLDAAHVAGLTRVEPTEHGEALQLVSRALEAQRTMRQMAAANVHALEGAERRLKNAMKKAAEDALRDASQPPLPLPRLLAGMKR